MDERGDSISTQIESLNCNCDTSDGHVSKPHAATKLIAPMLRVEELRDDGNCSAASISDLDETLSDKSDDPSPQPSPKDRSPQLQKPYKPPSEELKQKIKAQVEFYFSDANIKKDAFLLKHVRRSRQGYVSLKLITSFRKVKSLTKDYRETACSLRESEVLEVNEDGSKVRRKAPLPDYDETTPSRTVVAMNLPMEMPTIEEVAEMFSSCGEISLIRVLKPGKTVPPDIKKHMSKHPELANGTCAVVEFENHESAKRACETMTDHNDWRKGMSVTLLAPPQKKQAHDNKHNHDAKVKQQRVPSGGEGGETTTTPVSDNANKEGSQGNQSNKHNNPHPHEKNQHGGHRRKKSGGGRMDNIHFHEGGGGGASEGEGSWRQPGTQDARNFTRDSLSPQGGGHSPSASGNRYNSPSNSPRSSPRGSPNMRRRAASHGKSPLAVQKNSLLPSPESQRRKLSTPSKTPGGSLEASPSPSGSPWIQRRLKAQLEGGNGQAPVSSLVTGSPMGSPRLGRRLLDLEGVVRQPKGPEGTRGFYGGKGRGSAKLNA